MKNEIDHWSDPEFQISQGKYSPAAKTLMDRAALTFQENHPDLRIVIFNPSMILGKKGCEIVIKIVPNIISKVL